MPKKRTTVFVADDLIEPLEEYSAKTKQNLTELFNDFLRELLGIKDSPSLPDRVKKLEDEVEEIKTKLNG